jgi:DnaK suppressor protein
MTNTLNSNPGVDARSALTILLDRHGEACAEYEEQLARVAEGRRTLTEDAADVVDHGSHAADFANEELLALSLRQRRDQLADAVARLNDGAYGVCERCDEPINAERLVIFPAATLCVACQRSIERRH